MRASLALLSGFLFLWAAQADPKAGLYDIDDITSRYYTNEELAEFMEDFTTSEACSKISRKFSIGKSVDGVDLWVLEISDNPGVEEAEPNFKYVANMHGDEPGGRQLLIGLARWLCDNYPTDSTAKRIVEDMHIFLMPTMNPDGYANGPQRHNANNMDLNRNFPDRSREPYPLEATGFEEPEVLAVMNWVRDGQFVASANMHEGSLVANYPYDHSDDGQPGYARAPDDAALIHIAHVYADYHKTMHKSEEFKDGITNGNAWYAVYGGMQDWNYVATGCMELTLELSYYKNAPARTLRRLWNENVEAMLAYAEETCFGGASGFVKSNTTSEPVVATISVKGIETTVSSKPKFGDYYRILAPGMYQLTASADGYQSKVINIVVPEELGKGARADFLLDPIPAPDKPKKCNFWCKTGKFVTNLFG